MAMRSNPEINVTGGAARRDDMERMKEASRTFSPTAGDSAKARELRLVYARDASHIGGMPPPSGLKQAVALTIKEVMGQHASLFIDKVGERLAFERTGVRLYDALMMKLEAKGGFDGGPSMAQLQEIRTEELNHFRMLWDMVEDMGGDPSVITPAANVASVISSGIPKVLGDPRTTVPQCLDAILVAELADNDSWEMLARLADVAGEERGAEKFQRALEEERRHLQQVRGWLANYELGDATARRRAA